MVRFLSQITVAANARLRHAEPRQFTTLAARTSGRKSARLACVPTNERLMKSVGGD